MLSASSTRRASNSLAIPTCARCGAWGCVQGLWGEAGPHLRAPDVRGAAGASAVRRGCAAASHLRRRAREAVCVPQRVGGDPQQVARAAVPLHVGVCGRARAVMGSVAGTETRAWAAAVLCLGCSCGAEGPATRWRLHLAAAAAPAAAATACPAPPRAGPAAAAAPARPPPAGGARATRTQTRRTPGPPRAAPPPRSRRPSRPPRRRRCRWCWAPGRGPRTGPPPPQLCCAPRRGRTAAPGTCEGQEGRGRLGASGLLPPRCCVARTPAGWRPRRALPALHAPRAHLIRDACNVASAAFPRASTACHTPAGRQQPAAASWAVAARERRGARSAPPPRPAVTPCARPPHRSPWPARPPPPAPRPGAPSALPAFAP
jgi:hypothetical protein